MTFHGHAPRSPEKSSRFAGARGAVVRAGSCTHRIEFYFHSVKVVAPPVLHWPPPPPPPRAYQTYAVFLILILSPCTPLRRRFHEAFRSAGTFCLETPSPPLLFSLLVHRPSSRHCHSLLPSHRLFSVPLSHFFFLSFPAVSFVFVYERGSLHIEYTQDALVIKCFSFSFFITLRRA